MPYINFKSESGRDVEIEITSLNIRTPGRPLPRDFTCTAQLNGSTAFVKLGSGHSKANPVEVKRAVDEALKSIGVTRVEYEHNHKTVTYEV